MAFGTTELSLNQRAEVSKVLRKSSPNTTDENLEKLSVIFEDVYKALRASSPDKHPASIEKTVEWFAKWADAYGQESRYFHNIDHLRDMTVTSLADYEGLNNALANTLSADELLKLQRINTLAGFYHDVEYTQVDGHLTKNGQILMPYLIYDEQKKTYAVKAEFDSRVDPKQQAIINMVLAVFGQKREVALSPFTGMNELLSAMEAALDLQAQGVNKTDILAVVASIEATIPFRKKDRMEGLRANIENYLKTDNELQLDAREMDKIIGNATILANQDVVGLAGGLRPDETLTADHIREVMKGTDKLHAEEVPTLRTSKPGDYPPDELVKALYKQHTLFNTMLAPKNENIMVFHGAKMQSTGKDFPPQESLGALEDIVKEKVGPVVGLVLRARLAAVRALAAFAKAPENKFARTQGDKRPEISTVAELLDHGLKELQGKLDPNAFKSGSHQYERLAYEVLSGERKVGKNDTPRSSTAAYMLQELGAAELQALVPNAKLGPDDEPRNQINKGEHEAYREALKGIEKLSGLKDLLLPNLIKHRGGLPETLTTGYEDEGRSSAVR